MDYCCFQLNSNVCPNGGKQETRPFRFRCCACRRGVALQCVV
jgi:hypothetical protein